VSRYRPATGRRGARWDGNCAGMASPRSAPNALTEMAKQPAATAAKARRPIILQTALLVTARRARTICTIMSNLSNY